MICEYTSLLSGHAVLGSVLICGPWDGFGEPVPTGAGKVWPGHAAPGLVPQTPQTRGTGDTPGKML